MPGTWSHLEDHPDAVDRLLVSGGGADQVGGRHKRDRAGRQDLSQAGADPWPIGPRANAAPYM